MKFIVGIGNPGKQYEKTRHNIGFQVLDLLNRERNSSALWKPNSRLKAKVVRFEKDFLAKPLTFVNVTGEAVRSIIAEHNLRKQDLLFVCDDVNLEFGKLRLRPSGSAGGHHGLESVIEALGSEDFSRLRIGVKNDKMPQDLTGFVLEPFLAAEKKALEKILEKAASVCERWLTEDFESARDQLSQLQSNK